MVHIAQWNVEFNFFLIYRPLLHMVYKCLHHFKTHILTACNAGDQPHLAPAFHGLLRGAAHGYDRKAAAATIALGAAATSAQGFRCSGWGLRWGSGSNYTELRFGSNLPRTWDYLGLPGHDFTQHDPGDSRWSAPPLPPKRSALGGSLNLHPARTTETQPLLAGRGSQGCGWSQLWGQRISKIRTKYDRQVTFQNLI